MKKEEIYNKALEYNEPDDIMLDMDSYAKSVGDTLEEDTYSLGIKLQELVIEKEELLLDNENIKKILKNVNDYYRQKELNDEIRDNEIKLNNIDEEINRLQTKLGFNNSKAR